MWAEKGRGSGARADETSHLASSEVLIRTRVLPAAMGSVVSAFTRSRNTVVQLSSEPAAPQAAPSKLRALKSRSKGATKATAAPRHAPPAPGAWERRGRQKAEEDARMELSAVLKRSEEDLGTAGLVLPEPRRSRSACECDELPPPQGSSFLCFAVLVCFSLFPSCSFAISRPRSRAGSRICANLGKNFLGSLSDGGAGCYGDKMQRKTVASVLPVVEEREGWPDAACLRNTRA